MNQIHFNQTKLFSIFLIFFFFTEIGISQIENIFITNENPLISDPCTCDGIGGFDEELLITGNTAGEMWRVQSVSGLTYGSGGAPVAVGDLFVDIGNGNYVLDGLNHLDGIGYSLIAVSPSYIEFELRIDNKCFYPILQIDVPFDTIACQFTNPIPLIGEGLSPSDNQTPVAGTGTFTINGVVSTEINPNQLGVGTHTIEFCFDAGDALGFTQIWDGNNSNSKGVLSEYRPNAATEMEAQLDPGCEVCETNQFVILETSDVLTCNDRVNVSLGGNCEALITPDMILEGDQLCYDDYEVSLSFNNQSVDNPIGYLLSGQIIKTEVTHLPTGNKCWGTIIVEDKWAPELDCNIEVLDEKGDTIAGVIDNIIGSKQVLLIPCTVDPSDIPGPTLVNDCSQVFINLLLEEVIFEAACNTVSNFTVIKRILRTYGISDINGNKGDECTVEINVYQVPVQFPDDITWTCEQYSANPNIINPTALHPLILENIIDGEDDELGVQPYEGYPSYSVSPPWWQDNEDLDMTLDEKWDDNIDNPLTDNNNDCNTITPEIDTDPCKINTAANYQYCSLDPGGHNPDYVLTPVHNRALVDGLEDADILELTGSGEPRTASQHQACNHSFTSSDQFLEACSGQGTDKTFKILRTWTALNWCTGVTVTDHQFIKVLDKKGPELRTNFQELVSDQRIESGNHFSCASSGLIGPPEITEGCSEIATIRVFTPVGEATPVMSSAGEVMGYRIPSPYLELGRHDILVEVSDVCGNSIKDTIFVNVIDGIPPVNVCREVTQVSLSSTASGVTSIPAKYFDEGSYDYCSDVHFKVRKMNLGTCDNANIDKFNELNFVDRNCNPDPQEWFDDDVFFCCEEVGTTVNVILRVYDEEPDFSPNCGTTTNAIPSAQNEAGAHVNINNVIRQNCLSTNYSDHNCLWRDAANLNDHYNDCMVEVLVEDKIRPICVAPADVWINCDELPENVDYDNHTELDSLFGNAIAEHNCDAMLDYLPVNNQLDLCGVGRIVRRFRAVNSSGLNSLGSCQQIIMVQPVTDYCITFPSDFEGECDNTNNPNELEFVEVGCDLLAINKEVLLLNAGSPVGDECRKDLVTWKIINWCEYDGISTPTVLSRDANGDGVIDDGEYCSNGSILSIENIVYPSSGYYLWEQHVKIFDNTAPELSYDGDVKFPGGDLDEDPCTGQVDIEVEVDEQCTDATTTKWELSAFSSTFVSGTFSGNDVISGRYPLGTHTARFYVSDDCGNTSTIDITFDIVDAKAPTPVCYNGLSIEVMPASGMVEAWATDFDASSFDYCQDIKFAINRIEDTNGDTFITSDDYVTTPPSSTNVIFTCDDVGTIVYVQLWVGEVLADGCNDWDYCTTYMEVQDNSGVCSGSRPSSIEGNVSTKNGENIENVEISINGDMTSKFMTSADGNYHLTVNEGGDYSVTPMKIDDIRNGVSTFDLAMISKHILNVQTLESPYKIIAADANNSGSITTLDLVAIRKVVLFVSNEFPNNTNWRFVDKDYLFPNPKNPFSSVFPEVKNYNNISGVNSAEFVAIKIGDVSGDAASNSIEDRTLNGTFELKSEDRIFQKGEAIEVVVSADFEEIDGFQGTLKFDTKALELLDIRYTTMRKENFGTTMAMEGYVTISWDGESDEKEAFTLVFTAKNTGSLSEVISINSLFTKAEAYANGGYLDININFGQKSISQVFKLYQNTPNPFIGETLIGFELPKADVATLTISDLSGRILNVISGSYAAGYNSVVVNNTNNLPKGVLIFELKTSTHSATKKMTIMK